MNRIVREHYPVSKLPEDIRREFSGQEEVTLIVEANAVSSTISSDPEPPYGPGVFSRFRHRAEARYASMEEVVAHVRALRDEWDEREQELNKLRGS